jgi:Resolvase, N terminal domain
MSTTFAATVRAAIYARVSSDQQAQEQTIESQVAALRERVASDELTLAEELCFLDWHSEAVRPFAGPARATLRVLSAAGR